MVDAGVEDTVVAGGGGSDVDRSDSADVGGDHYLALGSCPHILLQSMILGMENGIAKDFKPFG